MRHICNKEPELKEMHDTLLVMKEDIKYIRKELEGNGKKGLIQQVRENTEWRWKAIGIGSAITFLLSAGLLHLGGLI